MLNIDVRRPMSPAQLAALYGSDPMRAEFDMSSQARSYVHGQASRMGITSPANHFAALQAAAINTAPQSAPMGWAQIEAAKHAEVYGTPKPGPTQTERQLAAAINGRTAPVLSALERTEAKRLGMTNEQFQVDQRMRQMGVRGALGQHVKFHNATPADLERDPRYRQLLQANPEKAHTVFSAVTGQDYGKYSAAQLALDKDRIKFQTDTLQKKLATGEWTWKDGQFLSRKPVPNPTGTGEMILANEYTPLDQYEQTLLNPSTQAAVLDPDVARRDALAAKKAEPTGAPAVARNLATLQKPTTTLDPGMRLGNYINDAVNSAGSFVQNLPQMSQQVDDYFGIPGMVRQAKNWGRGTFNMLMPALQGVGIGTNWAPFEAIPDTFQRPGQDPRRMRATLQNNAHFQALLKNDPQRAMALVAAMQNQ